MSDKITGSVGIIKEWFTFIAAVVACVATVIFWIQSASDSKFEKVEEEIEILREEINNIQDNNKEILRIIGRLEGKLGN